MTHLFQNIFGTLLILVFIALFIFGALVLSAVFDSETINGLMLVIGLVSVSPLTLLVFANVVD